MGAVGDDRQGTWERHSQSWYVGRETRIVDGDDRLGARVHGPRGGVRVEAAVVTNVRENGCRTEAEDGIRGCDKRQWCGDHFVSRPDAESADCQIECDTAVGDRNRMVHLAACFERALETRDASATRERPGTERGHNRGDVTLLDPVAAVRERL